VPLTLEEVGTTGDRETNHWRNSDRSLELWSGMLRAPGVTQR
jgi:hypothetical protein